MTESEWKIVWEKFCGLWPKLGESATTEEQLAYRRCCLNATEGEAVRALRTLKDNSLKFVQPAMVASQIRRARSERRPESASTTARRAALDREHQEIAQQWADIRAFLAEVPADELERHKRAAMAHDWRLRWGAKLPVTSRVWVAHLYHRIRDGLGPDDAPSTPVPDRPQAQPGSRPMREAVASVAHDDLGALCSD